jgi:hypothetical protein
MRLAKKEDFGKIIKIMLSPARARRKGNIPGPPASSLMVETTHALSAHDRVIRNEWRNCALLTFISSKMELHRRANTAEKVPTNRPFFKELASESLTQNY